MITTLPVRSLAAIAGGVDTQGTTSVLSRLEAKRAELLATLAKLRSDGLEISHVAEPMEANVSLQQREQRAGEIQRTNATLLSVNWAIARWGLGMGAECCRCGSEIGEKRLAAICWASLCTACASEEEANA